MESNDTKNFRFRPMELDDVAKIADWFLDFGDVAFFDRALPIPVNIDSLRESWRASLGYSVTPDAYWTIADGPDGNPAGVVGLHSINYIHGDAVLPAFVAKPFRGSGLATAMKASLIDMAFNRVGLHRLTTFYREDNAPTERALQKVGFKPEGRFREGWFANGRHYDMVIVGLLASEWAAERGVILDKLAQTCKLPLEPAFWERLRG